MPIRSSAGVNWAGIVLSGRGNADLHPDEDLPCWPFLCHSPVLLLPPWLHSPYRGGQKRFSMTVGDRVSGVNGKWPDFSAPISGNKHSPYLMGPFRLPGTDSSGNTSVHANPNNPPVLEVLQGMVWVQFLHPSPLGSWHQVQLFRVLTASWHIFAVQDISAWLPVTHCLALSFHIWTQRYIHRQKSPSFRSHRNQSREKIKTLQSVLGKQPGAAAGFAEPPTHLEHRPQRWGGAQLGGSRCGKG